MVDKSEKFTWLVRTGYAARGLVYILLGYLALSSAESARGGADAAFGVLQEIPLGQIVLYGAAIGLLAYAAFKFLSAVSDIEHHGSDANGLAHRIGYFASGIAHTLLSWTAFQFANGDKQAAGRSEGGEQAAATLLSWDLGALIVALVGLGFLVGALMQGRTAINARFMRQVGSSAPGAVCWLGRVGHAARAVVFLLIGWSLVRSAWFSKGADVKGLGEAVASLGESSVLYTLVAIGLILFGVFSLIVARYRIIPDLKARDLKPTR